MADEVKEYESCESSRLDQVYTERNTLVALISTLYPSWWAIDPVNPDWPVIYIDFPAGQLSWHVSRDEFASLFSGLKHKDEVALSQEWDEHTTDEKYRRIREYTSQRREL